MFRANHFDKLLDKATSSLRLEPDWPTILEICDLIRQNDCSPKYAVAAIKKKLYSQNPHQAMFGVLTLESVVKNCGSGIHDEVASKPFCETFRDLVKTTQYENLRNKILELIQAWAFAFRNTPRYRAVQDTVNILKAEGFKFPPLKESDAMFSADTAPEWADGEVCHRCRVAFSLMVRRHHCRACGQVFCQQCSSKTSTLPKFGIEKEVRVCDACYDKVSRPPSASTKLEIVDTSSDYGPTQAQKPPGKSAEELQEEEELQLALALSQSEAEQKEKDRLRSSRLHVIPDPASLHPTVSPTPSSVSASPEHSTGAGSELARYLDRSYWEQRAPTAPADLPAKSDEYIKAAASKTQEEEQEDKEIDDFVDALKSQVEIFVNRMKSNSSRGRSIANDTSVQSLFMNITAMHSQLLRYIQQLDDKRVYLESLQDKITQVRDSRAALDTLRDEHAARVAAAAEAGERQRQLQMAAKLQAMRKKKHEYLQYQRQLALQRVQEQEREMQMRQEQQKHQYMMSAGSGYFMPGVSMPQQYLPQYPNQPIYAAPSQFHQMMPQSAADTNMMPGQPQMSQANIQMGVNQPTSQAIPPQMTNSFAMSSTGMAMSQPSTTTQQTMSHPNIRPSLGQQLPMQQQLLMQQMHQMRMSMQPGSHQIMQQNVTNGHPGQNIPQQNGQPNQPKQNLPNQPQQLSANSMMMGQGMPPNQSNLGQGQMNVASSPMLGMQHQNVRLPMMQGNQPNINQQFPSGYPQNMPSHINSQQPGAQMPNMQQSHMQVPGQPMSLTGQPSMQVQQPSSINQGLSMANVISSAKQNVPQVQGQQGPIPQPNLGPQGQPMPQGPQMSVPSQVMPGQNISQGQQMINQPQMPPGQLPQSQGAQMYHPQQMGQPMMGGQLAQHMPGQIPQGQMPQGQQMQRVQQMPQGQPMPPGQHMPQGQQMPQGQPMPQGQQIPQGQQMPQVQQMQQVQQMHQGQQMSPGQQMPPGQQMQHNVSQGPQVSPVQQMAQNQPGQPQMPNQQIKTPQQNFGNAPPVQPILNQQVQTPVKLESNNNSTSELISFD